ncbi:MAG: AAA family ATPase [Desulfobacteraceae bacterium]|nr:AAA family ATPase [Desulfobacteraceae bacterium]
MIVVCPNCQSRYDVNDRDSGTNGNFIARCGKCQQTFTAYRPVRVEELAFLDIELAKKVWENNNIIAISNQKGGVAKTSTCLNLGLALTLLGKRVLMVDFDVQANLTQLLGYKEKYSFFDVINDENNNFEKLIIETKYKNLWLFPSTKNMVLLNKKYFGSSNFDFLLKDRIAKVRERYDYILIDTPPSLELCTLNALVSAKLVIIPSQCDYFSTYGINKILKLIELIKKKSNPNIDFRILVTMVNEQSPAESMICSKLKTLYSKVVFDTHIELDQRLSEAQIMNMPVLIYNQKSIAGQQYLRLAEELIGQYN